MRRPDRRSPSLALSLLATAFAAALIGLGVAVVLPGREPAGHLRAPAAAQAEPGEPAAHR